MFGLAVSLFVLQSILETCQKNELLTVFFFFFLQLFCNFIRFAKGKIQTGRIFLPLRNKSINIEEDEM